ncbi:nucleoside-diphosphate kinase [Streptomyces sp. ISL-98]|uniref:nucleoside-diphosphate kinase n=1 Tax=Streptomyces sp. ISL-98 TaxID=2819192 RepID=UPI0027E4DA39|nr:nucleoside-diphosphate kinase [Streptomyces sp. ISL-98]
MSRRPAAVGEVLTSVDWGRWSVILLKPDCVRRGLVDTVLERITAAVSVSVRGQMDVTVTDWQIHVHYWDLLVGADWFDCSVPACLRKMYVGRQVAVALAHGPAGTPRLVRDLLGHFDPARATKGTLRGDLGTDSLAAAQAEGRLVENLVHTSDDAAATCRDFGTWYGAKRHHLLTP